MTLEELIYTRLVQEKELAESLAKYEGVPAVFLQKAPDDKAQGWGVSQYPRADYLVDMTADPERHSSGMVSVNVYSDDTGKPPEELAPLVRIALCDVVMHSHFKSSEEIKDKKFKTQSKIYDVESFCREQEDIKDDITTLKGEITNLIKEKGNLRLERINIISPQYRKQRKELKAKLEKHRKNCETQKKALENLNWVINDPLSNSGMKTFIFDASLKSLNDCLDDYSSIIGFNIKFTVNTESSKRDFVTLIDKDGQLLQYEELSGGEQQLVNVAMAFALHSITSVSLGINLLFLDELFENLDKANIEIVMDLVKYIGNGKSIYIITHQENFSISGSNTIKVKKDNGITTIIP